jgi:hypothetical protein
VQWLAGLTWTTEDQLSLIGEAWHDGTVTSDPAWDAWQERNRALGLAGATAPPMLATPFAANLAWQATPWQAVNLRRDNVLLRASWTHEAWQPAVDLLWNPADAGRAVTASLAWQGDRWRFEGGVRRYGGPDTSLAAQLPLRGNGYLQGVRAF